MLKHLARGAVTLLLCGAGWAGSVAAVPADPGVDTVDDQAGLSSVRLTGPREVVVRTAVGTREVSASGTVADALRAAALTPDADDLVSPQLSSTLSEGLVIRYQRVDVRTVAKTIAVPYSVITKQDPTRAAGSSTLTVAGRKGKLLQTYQVRSVDGKTVSTVLASSELVSPAITERRTVGTSTKVSKLADVSPATQNTCKASYYWEGQMTASGERFNPNALTAAHKTLKLGTKIKVTNPSNGKTVVVRINDRGPYVAGRCLDLSKAAMKAIGGTSAGVITVKWERA